MKATIITTRIFTHQNLLILPIPVTMAVDSWVRLPA